MKMKFDGPGRQFHCLSDLGNGKLFDVEERRSNALLSWQLSEHFGQLKIGTIVFGRDFWCCQFVLVSESPRPSANVIAHCVERDVTDPCNGLFVP